MEMWINYCIVLIVLTLINCLPFTQKIRKFRMECQWKDRFCLPERKFFSEKRDFLKGRPKFPNGISEWKICVSFASFTSSRPFDLDCLCSRLPRKSLVKGTSTSPRKFPSRFDTSHLLQLPTNRFFRVNIVVSDSCLTLATQHSKLANYSTRFLNWLAGHHDQI